MDKSDQLNVVLFALTGFGNTVLKALLNEARVNVRAVFTVKYDHPFPYYEERQLLELCREKRIACYYGVKVGDDEGITLLRQHAPDLILVATFKQMLGQNVLSLPRLGVVNLHPSLLPRYRGPCPTQAALFNDEEVTGVTAHYVTEKLDEGNILLQKSIPIEETDDDGRLRNKLARLAGEMIPELIGLFAGGARPTGAPQDHSLATLAPRPAAEDGHLELATSVSAIRRRVRAFNPLPGASLLIGDRRVAVDRFELYQDSRTDGLYENDNSFDLIINSQAIRLYKKVS